MVEKYKGQHSLRSTKNWSRDISTSSILIKLWETENGEAHMAGVEELSSMYVGWNYWKLNLFFHDKPIRLSAGRRGRNHMTDLGY